MQATDLRDFESRASATFAPLRMSSEVTGHRAALRAERVRDVVVARIRGDPLVVRRDRGLISSGDPELIKVAWHRAGRAGVAQDDRQSLIAPGQLVAYDTTRPYELPFFERYDIVVLGIPRELLRDHLPVFGRPVPAESGLVRTIGAFLDGMAGALPEQTGPLARHHLANAMLSLVASAFTGARPQEVESSSPLFERIRGYCLANLADPGLSVRSVAAAHRISLRYLQKLAGAAGIQLAAWIRRQRLERIRDDLRDPALAHRSPAALAARWGMLDATHLSRACKAEFGRTPTQLRADAGL